MYYNSDAVMLCLQKLCNDITVTVIIGLFCNNLCTKHYLCCVCMCITQSDTFGNEQRSHSTACGYKAILYGPKYTSGVNIGSGWTHSHHGAYWMIWPREHQFYAQRSSLNLPVGKYTVQMQFARNTGAHNCATGWPGAFVSAHTHTHNVYI
jgi:hypothetical protein